MKTTEQKWYVLEDPQWASRHPLHKCRYIATKPAWDYVDDSTHGEEWSYGFDDSEGSVVCKLTDLADQPNVARLIAAAPEMLKALKMLREKLFADEFYDGKAIQDTLDQVICNATGGGQL